MMATSAFDASIIILPFIAARTSAFIFIIAGVITAMFFVNFARRLADWPRHQDPESAARRGTTPPPSRGATHTLRQRCAPPAASTNASVLGARWGLRRRRWPWWRRRRRARIARAPFICMQGLDAPRGGGGAACAGAATGRPHLGGAARRGGRGHRCRRNAQRTNAGLACRRSVGAGHGRQSGGGTTTMIRVRYTVDSTSSYGS